MSEDKKETEVVQIGEPLQAEPVLVPDPDLVIEGIEEALEAKLDLHKPLDVVVEHELHISMQKCKREVVSLFPNWRFIFETVVLKQNYLIETAATDGYKIYYNPNFIKTLNQKQRNFVFIHEIFHIVSLHVQRTPLYVWKLPDEEKAKVLMRWNIARDYAIHCILKPMCDSSNVLEWWPQALYDEKYNGMSSEKIYRILPKSAKMPSGDHFVVDPKGELYWIDHEGKMRKVKISDDLRKKMREISDLCKSAGGNTKTEKEQADQGGNGKNLTWRNIEKRLNPEVIGWREELIEFIVNRAKVDYTYRRYNRNQYLATGGIFPSLRSEHLSGTIAIDVSGSIDQNQYDKFAAEIESIRAQIPTHDFRLLFFSTEITRDLEVLSGQEIDWSVRGNGGTEFSCVYQYLEDEGITTDFMVFFTDGENSHSDNAKLLSFRPAFPTIFVLWHNPRDKQFEKLGRSIEMHQNTRGR